MEQQPLMLTNSIKPAHVDTDSRHVVEPNSTGLNVQLTQTRVELAPTAIDMRAQITRLPAK